METIHWNEERNYERLLVESSDKREECYIVFSPSRKNRFITPQAWSGYNLRLRIGNQPSKLIDSISL